MTLCDSSYPRKLAFHYLQDLQKEFERLDNSLVEKITRPYSFVKFGNLCNPTLLVWCYICMENWWMVFLVCTEIACYYAGISLFLLSNLYSNWLADGVIGSIRKQYIDTRTQANLSKLNANRKKDLEIITEHISEILQRKRNSGNYSYLMLHWSWTMFTKKILCILLFNCQKSPKDYRQRLQEQPLLSGVLPC